MKKNTPSSSQFFHSRSPPTSSKIGPTTKTHNYPYFYLKKKKPTSYAQSTNDEASMLDYDCLFF